jgi:hypothetical protein
MTHTIRPPGLREPHGGPSSPGDCGSEPRELTYAHARTILHAHDRHVGCRQWVAAAAYLSAGLDDE